MSPNRDILAGFSRTSRLILQARLNRSAGLILAVLLLLTGWSVWLVVGRVSIYASSQQMKLESEKLPLHVEVPVEGVVAECSLELGREVQEGDVLVRLDARPFELQRGELQAGRKATQAAIDALTQQLDAEVRVRNEVAAMATQTRGASMARVAAARTSAQFKERETAITRQLKGAELVSELDMVRAAGESEGLRAQAWAAAAQATLDTTTQRVSLDDRDARIAALKKTLVDAQAQADVQTARLESADFEVERRTVRALDTGTLADITPCTRGLDLKPGEILATLLPRSAIHVVSFFRPDEAIGRVRRGQFARLRIDNFPWTQYGTVDARVDNVGSEPREGLVRVELEVAQSNPSIPLTHGMTGAAEVEIEKVSPFKLLLRMAGQQLSPPPPRPAGEPVAGQTR